MTCRAAVLAALMTVLTACQPTTPTPLHVLTIGAPAIPSSEEPKPEQAPPPADPCADYEALEAGAGAPARQDWFDHLAARHGDKGYARTVLACRYHGGADQFAALDELWQLEDDGGDDRDGHDWHATNVPQAKPFAKMGCSTIDHRCQDRWGLAYIAERYGTPIDALAAWRSRRPHWY